jgi:branched-chain amino acid transport system substrate-binding protein
VRALQASALAFAAALASVALGGCSGGDAVVVGVTGPFSEPRGTSMRLAAELARDEVNEAGGIGGRRLELSFIDDSASADVAVRAAQRFVDDPSIVAVIGHLTSGPTLAAAPIYGGDDAVAMITPSASNPLLTDAGPYIFRACPTDLVHGARLGEWARRQFGAQRVTVLYQNDAYGRGVRMAFASRFEALGGTVVSQNPYLPDSDLLPYLQRAVGGEVIDAIVVAGTREDAERAIGAMGRLNLRVPVLGADALAGLRLTGDVVPAVHMSMAWTPDAPGALNRTFVTKYRDRYAGRSPDHRGATTYDIVHLLSGIIARHGDGREAIRDALARVGTSDPAHEGVTGAIGFDEHGDLADGRVVMVEVKAGE